jgi:hypothetical protein
MGLVQATEALQAGSVTATIAGSEQTPFCSHRSV